MEKVDIISVLINRDLPIPQGTLEEVEVVHAGDPVVFRSEHVELKKGVSLVYVLVVQLADRILALSRL